MSKLNSIKSGMVLTALVIGLVGCSQPRRDQVTREPVYNSRSSQNNSQRNSSRSSRRSEEVCNSCGYISAIDHVQQDGRGTGVGAVIGALVGGIAGHQVGGGTGKQVATVAGVIGGAVVGNNIEENRNDDSYYEVTIDMDRGGQKTLSVNDAGGLQVGSRVSVFGTTITLR